MPVKPCQNEKYSFNVEFNLISCGGFKINN